MSIVHHFLGECDVFFEGKCGTVNHDRAEAHVDAALAGFEAVTVVKVQHDFGVVAAEFFGVCHSTFSHVAEKSLVGVGTCAFGNLENHRALLFDRSLDDCLELLHVVEVEGGNGIATVNGSCKHVAGVYEAEVFVVNHNCVIKFRDCSTVCKVTRCSPNLQTSGTVFVHHCS